MRWESFMALRSVPVRGTLEDVAVRLGYRVGKLTGEKMGSFDMDEGMGGAPERHGEAFRGKGNDDAFGGKQASYGIDGRGQVAVSGDEESGVEAILEGVGEEGGGDVDVGHFLSGHIFRELAAATGARGTQIVTEVKPAGGDGLKGFDVRGLSAGLFGRAGNPRSKIVALNEGLIGLEEAGGERVDIEPIEVTPAPGLETIKEVETVQIGDHPLHARFQEIRGSYHARNILTSAASGPIV